MAIGSVIERSGTISVYDERGVLLFSRSGALLGYTPSTLTIRQGSETKTFDARGVLKFSR